MSRPTSASTLRKSRRSRSSTSISGMISGARVTAKSDSRRSASLAPLSEARTLSLPPTEKNEPMRPNSWSSTSTGTLTSVSWAAANGARSVGWAKYRGGVWPSSFWQCSAPISRARSSTGRLAGESSSSARWSRSAPPRPRPASTRCVPTRLNNPSESGRGITPSTMTSPLSTASSEANALSLSAPTSVSSILSCANSDRNSLASRVSRGRSGAGAGSTPGRVCAWGRPVAEPVRNSKEAAERKTASKRSTRCASAAPLSRARRAAKPKSPSRFAA